MTSARVYWDVPVKDRLCRALYAASRTTTARYRPILAPLNLTYPQYLVMAVLWQSDRQAVGSVAQVLSLDASTISPLLKRLESMGLLARERDPLDERQVIISLTPRGSALREDAATVPKQICEATGLSLEAYADLVRQLEQMRQTLQEGVDA